MKSYKGQFVIASPKLMDPNFHQTVVFMVQHGDDGALGLILNRPLDTTVRQAWKQVSEGDCDIDEPVYHGGPCEGPLMVLHARQDVADLEAMPGVYFTTDRDSVEQLVDAPDREMRFFVGYAGWSPGQLEAEMADGGWLVTPANSDELFGAPDELWESLFRKVAEAGLPKLNPKVIPEDPSMN